MASTTMPQVRRQLREQDIMTFHYEAGADLAVSLVVLFIF